MSGAHALLTGLVDYAGLFPPAARSMAEAVRRYARHLQGPRAWMLGRFIVPAARLVEFRGAAALQGMPAGASWRLAALLGQDEWADLAQIARFNQSPSPNGDHGAMLVDACEVRTGTADDVRRILAVTPRSLSVVCEVAPDAPGRRAVLEAVRDGGGGAKLRTGGTDATAVPSTAAVAAFVWDCVAVGVPFKATAGLHHPVRSSQATNADTSGPRAPMHGFLNLFAAAMLARAAWDAGLRETDRGVGLVTRVLDEEDPAAFGLDDAGLRWRAERLPVETVRRFRRDVALSFGSCSFDEPVSDLLALGVTLDGPRERRTTRP